MDEKTKLQAYDNYKEIYEHVNSDYPLAVYFVKPDLGLSFKKTME